jgi:hypothetical protein
MIEFRSDADREQLVQILKLINPLTAAAYGPPLDAWAFLARFSPQVANRVMLVGLLRAINPLTVAAYGPVLDAWAAKLVNPWTASAYGPLLDSWAKTPLAYVRRVSR